MAAWEADAWQRSFEIWTFQLLNMSLTKESFTKLSKTESWELYQTLLKEKADVLDGIDKKITDAVAKIVKLEADNVKLEARLEKVEGELAVAKACNQALKEGTINLERKSIQDNQYHRLENVEFSGIPAAVKPDELEAKVIGVAKAIGVNLNPRDFAACHRLPKGDTTIARFVNRKDVDALFANCRKLKDADLSAILGANHKPVYVNTNLCPELRNMRWKAKKLKEAGLVAFFGVSRRGPYVQREEKGTKHHVFVNSDLSPFLDDRSLDEILQAEI